MMKTIVTLIINPAIDKNSIDGASSSASGENFVYPVWESIHDERE